MSNTNTEVLTTAYEKLQGALTQSNTVLPKLEEAVKNADLSNYATVSDLEEKASKDVLENKISEDELKNINDGFVNLENTQENRLLKKQYGNNNNIVMTEKNISYVFKNNLDIENIKLHGQTMYVKDGVKYKFRTRNSKATDYENKYTLQSVGDTEKTDDNYVLKVHTQTTGGFDTLNTTKDYTINSPVPLRSIYGVYDELDIKNKKVIQRINSKTITGNWEFTILKSNDTYIHFKISFGLTEFGKALDGKEYGRKFNTVLCDRFNTHCTRDSVERYEHCGVALVGDGSGILFTLPISAVGSTTDEIKTYFTNNPTTIFYELLKPIEYDVTIEDNSFITVWPVKNRLKINCTNDIAGLVSTEISTDLDDVKEFYENDRFVSYNGALQVIDSELCNQFGTPFQLRGMSTFHLNKSNQNASYNMIKTLKLYGCNYIRVVNYISNAQDGSKGYLEDAENLKTKIKELVNAAIEFNMYVCIDWHGLKHNNPLDTITEAKEFFTAMTTEYKDCDNVIFELFNEPPESCWDTQLIPFYDEIIPLIRGIKSDAMCIIGTPNADEDLASAVASPLSYDNIVYCFHTYGSMKWQYFVGLSANLPLFISEWGVGDASLETQESANYGNSEFMIKEWQRYNSSWAMWSLVCKEGCHNFSAVGNMQDGGLIGDDLSKTGQFIINYF